MYALRARDLTGEGQVVDIGLYEPVFRILDELAAVYHQDGPVRQRMGAGTVNAVPHSHYPSKDGRWLAIACTTDKIFARLAALMGRDDVVGGGKYTTYKAREAARDEVDAFVAAWTVTMPRHEVLALCDEAQVPCGPVYGIDEIFADPQYRARGNIAMVKDPRVGEVALANVVPVLSATPGRIDSLGPPLGAHTDEILGNLLGMTAEQLFAMRDKGVI
jgi:crotonobetainyl-CoA:carnitine CoA-transferase CaiB-like acyl-CoA transferase